MLNTLRNNSIKAAGLKAALAAVLLAGSAAASAVTVDLCATAGTTTAMPVGVPVWGYATGACPATVAAPGGPVIYASVGEVVTVNLANSLSEATGLVFQGQAMVPDATGAAATTGTKTYTFTAVKAGTYLYQAAPIANAEHQVAKGLYGALVVRGADIAQRTDSGNTLLGDVNVADLAALATDVGLKVSGPGIPVGATIVSVVPGVSFAMSAAATAGVLGDPPVSIVLSKSSAYGATIDDEAVLVLSEIDPVLNASATPTTFDMRTFAPRYFLINGKAYPDTAPIASVAGHKLLLRYVNAGSKHHSMGALGLRQNFIAKDGSALPTANVGVTAETLATGQTGDALITVPAAGRFAVYDASLSLHNSSAPGLGGMLTFVDAGASAAATGPTTSTVAIAPNPTNGSADATLSATVSSAAGTVTAAEYFIDTKGIDGSGTPMTGAFGAATVAATATVSVANQALLTSGNHTLFVHGTDGTTWGGYGFTVLNLDKTGPVNSALALSPNPSNGAVAVTLSASASDSATGGSNVTAASYSVDGGAAVAMTLGGSAAPVRGLTALIPAGLTLGAHTVAVTSTDALGNVGAAANITLTVASTGPTTSTVAANPNPNNGTYTISSNQPVLRVTAVVTGSPATNVVNAAEGFIDSTPLATVRGFPFVPVDGVWNTFTENASVDIPIANIGALSTGTHLINVRGRDATGTWGAFASVTLLIDRTAPTLASGSLTSAALVAFGTPSATLTFVAADAGGAGLFGIQYWFDSATPPANPAKAEGASTATINISTLAGGAHTLYFRARDAANNVSTTVVTATLTVLQAVTDNRNINANNNATQTSDTNNGNRLIANDLPGGPGRTTIIASAPVRTGGAGAGTIAISCPAALGIAATPAIGGSTVCTNGAYRVTLTGVGATGALRRASKVGTFQFTYTVTLSGVSSTGTVNIRVN
jgi:Multicopper oxidase